MLKEIRFDWEYPKIFEPALNYEGRYIALTGGRASGKSWVIAHKILQDLTWDKKDVLCAREHQNSISESNYKLFVNIINRYGLPYDVLNNRITSKTTGARIIFVGLSDVTADNVKSFEDFRLVWLEEAQKISKKSWEILNPTIRAEGAQIIITMNPEVPHEKHPMMSELLTMYKDDTLHIHSTYMDNPFCSKDIIKQAELTKIHKPEDYERIWLGIADGKGSNLIVKGFSKDNIKPLFYQKDLDLHITCDFNYDPMCWAFAHKTQNKIYQFGELVEERTSTELCARKVIEMFPDHKGGIIINGDAAGRQHNCMQANPDMTNYKILQNALQRHYGHRVELKIHKGNPNIIKRHEAFNNLVRRYDGEICYYVSPECKWTIFNCENAMYKEGTSIVDEPTPNDIKKDPDKKFLIHMLDAISYMAEYYFPIEKMPAF